MNNRPIPGQPAIYTGLSPSSAQIERTLEHLTGREADPRETGRLLRDLQVTRGAYAPGGEVSAPSGNRPIR